MCARSCVAGTDNGCGRDDGCLPLRGSDRAHGWRWSTGSVMHARAYTTCLVLFSCCTASFGGFCVPVSAVQGRHLTCRPLQGSCWGRGVKLVVLCWGLPESVVFMPSCVFRGCCVPVSALQGAAPHMHARVAAGAGVYSWCWCCAGGAISNGVFHWAASIILVSFPDAVSPPSLSLHLHNVRGGCVAGKFVDACVCLNTGCVCGPAVGRNVMCCSCQ
jgi:hypothetical protein